MIIPTYLQEKIVETEGDKAGYPTDAFSSFLRNILQNMQLSLSDEGYLVPSVTAAQMATIQSSFRTPVVDPNSQTTTVGVQVGTLLFNTETPNGGAPNGQLYILLNDGTFHPVTNT